MAIDGVKIIDSDDAYDIYNDIVERYKDGEEIEKIKQEWIDEEKNFCTDELHTEIYWTALAYSLWEIGCLNERIKTQTLDIIKEGAYRIWMQILFAERIKQNCGENHIPCIINDGSRTEKELYKEVKQSFGF